jgi:threonine/homoserine efflux transporter RhtA
MIELDNGPLAISLIIAIAFIGPILYAIFIDRNEKK